MAKQSSPEMSSLASRVMQGYQPTPAEIRSLAASVLSQDETPATPKLDALETKNPVLTEPAVEDNSAGVEAQRLMHDQ